ncbi:hypothetical protein BDY24DRAFT_442857 [Mrakia frigida]|uniref:uncharacterized protein n=1 Tax=Mrakia frigida TaxID=29902 RepID=UPI003FCC2725
MPPRARASYHSSTSASASKKRKTTPAAEEEAPPPPPPTPSPTYFFADGNVLLHVGSTLFKVHRGVLEKAEVFADTLLVGCAQGGEEEAIPTIKLDDKEEDWTLFLRAMYDGMRVPQSTLASLEGLYAYSYNHTSIFTGAKGLFVSRVTYENYLSGVPGPDEDSPYQDDVLFPPFSIAVTRGLLVLQEKFQISRSSVRCVYNDLATHGPSERASSMGKMNNGLDWFPPEPSMETRYSLLLRVEAVAVLSSSAFKYDDYHSSTCEEDPGCRSASKDFRRTILADYFVHDYYYDSIMLAITSLEDKKEKDVLKMKEGCVKKALAFWEQKKVALEEEMKKDFGP